MYGLPRGMRNNNPFNIRISNNKWMGKITPPQDRDFEQFTTLGDGIHAGLVILRNYYRLHGLSTIKEIINRWAPASENPTSSYVEFVCKRCAVNADDKINVLDPRFLLKLASAIIEDEQGSAEFIPQEQLEVEIRKFPYDHQHV